MKILSLTEPWASLVAVGAKRIETRSWPTKHRGSLAIHASKGMPYDAVSDLVDEPAYHGPLIDAGIITRFNTHPDCPPAHIRARFALGCIIAVCDLEDCFQFTRESVAGVPLAERYLGNYELGRYGFRLANVRRLGTPVPARGALGLWTPDAATLAAIESQLS